MEELVDLLNAASSGPVGLLVGGLVGSVLGLLFAALFEEPLKRVLHRRIRRLGSIKKRTAPARGDHFSWGRIRVPFLVIEGSGEETIDEQRVKTQVMQGKLQVPDQVREWRAEIEKEQLRNRRTQQAHFWNGPKYAIERFTVSRTPLDEDPEIFFRMRESDYFTFMAAQQLDRDLGDGTTLRERYLVGKDPVDEVPAFMSSSLGTNIAVVTADGMVIFSKRSGRVGSRPLAWNSSANEALSKIDSDGRSGPSLYGAARRGLREELALQEDEYDINLLAIGMDLDKHQWAAMFVAETYVLTGSEFLERVTRGISDKWEHQTFELAPFTVKGVFRFMHDPQRIDAWSPTAPALFYTSLVHRHGRHIVERVTRRETRRLGRR